MKCGMLSSMGIESSRATTKGQQPRLLNMRGMQEGVLTSHAMLNLHRLAPTVQVMVVYLTCLSS